MPNYCHNTLFVEGEKKKLRSFKKDLESMGDPYSIELLFPMPEILNDTIAPSDGALGKEYSNEPEVKLAEDKGEAVPELRPCNNNSKENQKKLIEKFGYSDWYEWKNNNWGTKWIMDFEVIQTLNEKLVYYFDSAWAPPVSLLENISVKYPHLKFSISYNIIEEMGDESRVVSVENGKVQ